MSRCVNSSTWRLGIWPPVVLLLVSTVYYFRFCVFSKARTTGGYGIKNIFTNIPYVQVLFSTKKLHILIEFTKNGHPSYHPKSTLHFLKDERRKIGSQLVKV